MSTTRSEYNYNLAVEAAVRKVMSEMAIKNANCNDTVASTETKETASLSTVSDHSHAEYVVVVDRSAMMAVQDKALTASGCEYEYEYESGDDEEEKCEIFDENDEPVAVARALSDFDSDPESEGLNGLWRSTFDGDEIAVVAVEDDLDGILTIEGFMGGNTCGKYVRNSADDRIAEIDFIDADENWPVNGDVKGEAENVIIWSDGTRWDRIN